MIRYEIQRYLTRCIVMHDTRVMQETMFETIKRRLEGLRGELPRVAEDSGVHIATIRNIINGRSKDPGVSVIQKLLDYFKARDEMMAKLRRSATGA